MLVYEVTMMVVVMAGSVVVGLEVTEPVLVGCVAGGLVVPALVVVLVVLVPVVSDEVGTPDPLRVGV
ncbi:hypothetical protein BJX68DRAFT_249401 [Aspergillus pseudodeflectus]|uniref:Uncharacterized protein n=1 Tax=Aspergillus pseudodeflectus TaxID=176178 RepID=A0ABR4JD90_9EURO